MLTQGGGRRQTILRVANFTVCSFQAEEPVLKIELKPFVCSLAVANNVTMVTRAVNRRPIFLSMQPVVIGNGAKMKPVGHFYMYIYS